METRIAEIRPLDDLGRVAIPKPIREAFGWGDGTRLEVSADSFATNTVILKAASPTCSLCQDQAEFLLEVEKGYVCPKCAAQIK